MLKMKRKEGNLKIRTGKKLFLILLVILPFTLLRVLSTPIYYGSYEGKVFVYN
jgi:hypothetical protein